MNKILLRLCKYSLIRRCLIKCLVRNAVSEMYSVLYRAVYKEYFEIDIGMYSYGLISMKTLPRGLVVGRYVSIADGVKIFRRNHPVDTLTQHPFFYNSQLGYVKKDTIANDCDNPLVIGSDVWIGANVIILPSCRSIGDGAVIGAGSVVTKDVQPFSINVGNPCEKIKMRFDEEIVDKLTESKWWGLNVDEVVGSQRTHFIFKNNSHDS
ncbi:CatB-related O-acetyltransferase [Amphritea sp. HPY]|uniref:CatB-related O-acetyltransferase n=1 Tax=Amphritea sp. HPY TaxID=3421652 RepID=UPI003D7CD363